jgi:uncharacterized protein (DUF1697 family)
MPCYVALLRGIGPTNPNHRNDKLARVLEKIGCSQVQPILTSGNLVFRSTARSTVALEKKIERALHDELAVATDVLVRSQAELEALVRRDPFAGAEHGKDWYLTVTFRKSGEPPICTRSKRAEMHGPDLMVELEHRYGKQITTRTWNTVHKIVAKMQQTRS